MVFMAAWLAERAAACVCAGLVPWIGGWWFWVGACWLLFAHGVCVLGRPHEERPSQPATARAADTHAMRWMDGWMRLGRGGGEHLTLNTSPKRQKIHTHTHTHRNQRATEPLHTVTN